MLFKNLSHKINKNTLGTVHFSGIGGIGMSGIAKIMHALGFKVQGSDVHATDMTQSLKDLGIPVIIEQTEQSIAGTSIIVRSTAIKDTNPEIIAARKIGLPILKRAEMLGEIMRMYSSIAIGGTHGKTTTTSLIGHILEVAKLDPTVITGGIINEYKNNIRLGKKNIMVVEADESDGSLIVLPALWAVITNIDNDHMDYYKNIDHIIETFKQFVHQVPFYGYVFICIDDSNNRKLISNIEDRQFISYGFSPQANIQARNASTNPHGQTFDVVIKQLAKNTRKRIIKDIDIPLYGHHNILNTLAAISVTLKLQIPPKIIKKALKTFHGVKRRFTKIPIIHGPKNITIIDDYAHHPVEIRAVLDAVDALSPNHIIVVFQPHRFSRLNALFEDFTQAFHKADTVLLLPVYQAGEVLRPSDKTHHDLVEAAQNYGHKNVIEIHHNDDCIPTLNTLVKAQDMILFLGAGNISQIAYEFGEKWGT